MIDTGYQPSKVLSQPSCPEAFQNTSFLTLVFPSAQLRPYTMYAGDLSTVWHDRNILRNNS